MIQELGGRFYPVISEQAAGGPIREHHLTPITVTFGRDTRDERRLFVIRGSAIVRNVKLFVRYRSVDRLLQFRRWPVVITGVVHFERFSTILT